MKKTVNGIITSVLAAGAVLGTLTLSSCEKKEETKTVKVGILHSLSGTMAISETSVRDAEMLAIKEINAKGGVLGKLIEVVQEDGASEPQIFAEKARKLIQNNKVATIFGCWTSASRKAVKPVVEETGALLWYPVQYEGMEASPNIMYMGAAPNQQAVPAVEFCADKFGKNMFLVGSDYVFPRTANKIIKAQLANIGGSVAGEEYTPMGHTDFATIVSKIQSAKPDCIINTLNGDSNVAFFKQLTDAGITAESIPVMRSPRKKLVALESKTSKVTMSHGTTTRQQKLPRMTLSLPLTRHLTVKRELRTIRLKPVTSEFTCGQWLPKKQARST